MGGEGDAHYLASSKEMIILILMGRDDDAHDLASSQASIILVGSFGSSGEEMAGPQTPRLLLPKQGLSQSTVVVK